MARITLTYRKMAEEKKLAEIIDEFTAEERDKFAYGIKICQYICKHSSSAGYVEVLKLVNEFITTNPEWRSKEGATYIFACKICEYACSLGCIDILKYTDEITDYDDWAGDWRSPELLDAAAEHGHLNCLQFCLDNECDDGYDFVFKCLINDKVEILKWLHEEGWIKSSGLSIDDAADYANKNFECFKYAVINKFPIDDDCELQFNCNKKMLLWLEDMWKTSKDKYFENFLYDGNGHWWDDDQWDFYDDDDDDQERENEEE